MKTREANMAGSFVAPRISAAAIMASPSWQARRRAQPQDAIDEIDEGSFGNQMRHVRRVS
jgi:hypothetical protein